MGFGSDPFGAGRWGEDLPLPGTPLNVPLPSPALLFDGQSKDHPIDDDGRLKTLHWVDAAVFANARIPLGSIRSAQDLGSTVQRLRFIDKNTVQAEVEDRVRTAQKKLLDGGYITILRITVDTRVKGRIVYALDYVNNVTKKRGTRTGTS